MALTKYQWWIYNVMWHEWLLFNLFKKNDVHIKYTEVYVAYLCYHFYPGHVSIDYCKHSTIEVLAAA